MPNSRDDLFPVVAIGASAGGLEAYTEFFQSLASGTGFAFVLVQHLDPSHHSMLSELVAKATRLPVEEVKSGTRIKPDRVYVIPPNAVMVIAAGVFKLTLRSKKPGLSLPINAFMRSLATERKSKAIGIVLSGTGADGTLGLEDIKAEGGVTFAQDPSTAKYDGMPRSAIDSGCVDFVLPLKEMSKELIRIGHHPYVDQNGLQEAPNEAAKESRSTEPSPDSGDDFAAVLSHLQKASGVDFSQYKPNTIQRRTLRRMMILKLDTLSDYAEYLQKHPEERQRLYDDVLIPVTSFFRDLEVFEALKKNVYPAIVKAQGNNRSIRMWAPGCSTGEETYSLAMTLLEFLGDKASSFQVQLFGTDLSERGIQKARVGVYRESIAEEISAERMQRFFVKVDAGYRINKAVRDMCVFARQNVANDPPFSHMNLVACRNLLIYIQPGLQRKIIPILHYALKPSGFLVLGGSESVSAFPELFSAVDKKHRIYAKKATASRLHYDFVQSYYPIATNSPAGTSQDSPGKLQKHEDRARDEYDIQAEADRVVLKSHAPVGVVINSSMEVIQFRGRTTPYLEQAPGKPSVNVLKLAQNGLAIELRPLIAAATKQDKAVKKDAVPFEGNGHKRILNLSVSPLGDNDSSEKRHFLVLFDDVTPQSAPATGTLRGKSNGKAEAGAVVRQLKRELADARDTLRTYIESEDSIREESQSANEEILSANEELQSTNEELETSKEELQSASEEMSTLNAELQHKNSELTVLNNDLSNFLNSTKIPLVMVDRGLRIRRFTPTANQLLKIVESDIGRPIVDLRSNIEAPDLDAMIAKVLENLQPVECDVRDLDGHWHSLGILPYQTLDNKIDGAVITLRDIDFLKSANEQLTKSSDFFRGVIDTVREALLVLDSEFRVVAVNESYLRDFKATREQTVGRVIYSLGDERWNIPNLHEMLEQVLPVSRSVADLAVDNDFGTPGHKTLLLNARILTQANDRQPLILLAIENITERRRAQAALLRSEKLAAAGRLAATLAHEINNPLQAITNLITLLGQSPRLDSQDRTHATMAEDELSRIARLTQQALSFYRESISPTEVNIEEALESLLSLYEKRLKKHQILISKHYRSGILVIQSYPGETRQVFATLLVNALEATHPGGTISVRLLRARHNSVSGIRVSICDNGTGIPPDIQENIFEPFFTTKGVHGTGLGLWVASTIVQRLGGSIHLRSSIRPGKSGSCFSVFLPIHMPNPNSIFRDRGFDSS